jgi:hypothetical protein
MNDLIIELDRVSLRRELLEALRGEFEVGGLISGRFSVGDITAAPEMVYFLWHDAGEPPVSMLIRRENFSTLEGTRAAARDFLFKWKKRLG